VVTTGSFPRTSPIVKIPPSTRPIADGPTNARGTTNRSAQSTFSNSLIGNPTGVGSINPGTGTPRAQRVNPAGGIIGSNPGASGGLARTRQSSSRDSEEPSKYWDPDNPWVIREGVSPVLLPPEKQNIDPGPAIGLP
jgi:hypothetical protein